MSQNSSDRSRNARVRYAKGNATLAGRAASLWARFDDAVDGTTLTFTSPRRELAAMTPDDVLPLLTALHAASEQGRWAFGYLAYEAAAGIDESFAVSSPTAGTLPLAWFGLSDEPPTVTHGTIDAGSAHGYQTGPWTLAWNRDEHRCAVERVKTAIADGDTYQCNLTTTTRSPFVGDTEHFYLDLLRAQRCRYGAYLDVAEAVIASASPELFFEWTTDQIVTRPMKGTARRGQTADEDHRRRADLLGSEKERAENVMIVDLLRNDLGKIADIGSVDVPALFRPERYETVWQLTSDVTARPRTEVTVGDIVRALFPCGSVTGAPKAATMRLICALEAAPRGVYCGAIGFVPPAQSPLRARFSVAIRTAVIDRTRGHCSYGVGSGITWDSDADAEYDEIEAKTAILSYSRR
jgi:para-aminobenzoate synthetase/4-amino-4-deoxychorismate lyase